MRRVRKATPPRLPFIHTDHAPPLYLVTFNTHLRRPLLACPAIHQAFRTFAGQAEAHRIAVGRYVLLPDHAHLFVRIAGEMTLSTWVRMLKQTLGRALADQGQTPAQASGQRLCSFWQPGFHDHLLRHDESYAEKWRYVWMNPVRAGLASAPDEWPYQGEIVLIDRA